MKIEIYDTTLRDGAQTERASFSLSDKLRISQKLDEFGFDYIEGGWPASNPKDFEFFKKIKSLKLKNSKICAFGMTCRKEIKPEKDFNLKKLLEAETKNVTIFGKSWDLHVLKVLKTSLKENLRLIRESCRYLKNKKKIVFYDAEHFFDGFKTNPSYAIETIKAAEKGGAERIILCDTNGGSLSWEIEKIVKKAKEKIKVPLGIHCHNDGELAVANSLAAVRVGVIQVQGTINGIGERCGNANLCSLIPNLQLKMDFECLKKESLLKLKELANFVSEILNLRLNPFQPFVGESAFSHKGGVHVDAILKYSETYQHINPFLVGNFPKIVVSELAGKSNVLFKLKQLGFPQEKIEEITPQILGKIKDLENQGFQFEMADASLELLCYKFQPDYQSPFEALNFSVDIKKENSKILSEAFLRLKVKNKIIETRAQGVGPVHALDCALRKALLPFYPKIKKIRLDDYKVRILNEKEGTAAKVRVFVELTDKKNRWISVGCSENIIEASWQALSDSLEYTILKKII